MYGPNGKGNTNGHSFGPCGAGAARIVIAGTGFAGICMGIRLKQAGIHSFTIYEQAGAIGGTWRDNDYPGAACDVPSHLYSFSFEPNPRWGRMFAEQKEIFEYLNHCVDKYGIRSHIRFHTPVTGARFDEKAGIWKVTVGDGEQVEADFLVAATGFLSRPAYPQIPGLGSFQGKVFHSARWDHRYDLDGKTVAVIGTGASSIQFVPQIAPRVAQLSVFQRTPPWILPKADRVIPETERRLYTALPALQRLHRLAIYWLLELRVLGFAINPKLMTFIQRGAKNYLAQAVPDAALREKLTPKYTIGCKRILISNDYYPALLRPNVEVVDAPIREIITDGVITEDGRHRKVQALILGTGFSASNSQAPFPVHGRGGRDLDQRWRDGAEAYLGGTVAGFPNLFMIVGPNTGLGHSSMVFMIESQVAYTLDCLAAMRRRGSKWLDVREDVQKRYNDRLQQRLGKSVWASGCASWYQTRTGKITTLWPGFTFTFRRLTRRVEEADYRFEV